MTTKMLDVASTPLERNVARWIDARASDYDNGAEGVLNDLWKGGCASGMVGHLIYYKDTLNFYRKFRSEIDKLYYETLQELGELKLNGWDDEDPFAKETTNRNILAWFGFEETARKLSDRAGLEI